MVMNKHLGSTKQYNVMTSKGTILKKDFVVVLVMIGCKLLNGFNDLLSH